MQNIPILAVVIIGFLGGVLSGLVGVGGGIILTPALVLLLAYEQKLAQGTTLAVLALPVVALGVWQYYQNGHVNFKVAGLLAIGFIFGGYFGAKIAHWIPEFITLPNDWVIRRPLRKLFALILLYVAFEMLRK